MTRSVKWFLIIIGGLSILSGIYMAVQGFEFSRYFSGILVGITLVGSVFFYKEAPDKKE